MVKAWIVGAGTSSVLLLLAGCAPELAQTPIGQEEAAWQQSFRQTYSNYRPPRTAPPATVDNVSEKLREKEQVAQKEEAPAEIPQPTEDDPARLVDAAADGGKAPAAKEEKPAAAAVAKSEAKPEAKPEAKSEAGAAAGKKNSFTATPPEPTNGTVYEVKAGDTLSGIAKRFYGDASAAGVIERANVDLVKNPNRLRPGMKLIIPKL